MKIAVLGGNGFIGSKFCSLVAQNEEVICFDIHEPMKKNNNIQYVVGDYFDIMALEGIVKNTDIVVHAISLLNPTNSNEKYFIGYSKEVVQLVHLCELISKYKKKLIFLSSGGTVYGDSYNVAVKETFAINPLNHYGSIKANMENVIRTFRHQVGMRACIARLSNPYGEGQDFHKGVGFIDAVVRKGILGDIIEVWGDGENVRDYIHIDDVCKMLYSLCKCEVTEDIYNISTGLGTSQNQIIAYVSHVLGPLSIVYKDRRLVDVRVSILDNSRICRIYMEPLICIRDGIVTYIEYMKTL